jgi:hypothetical protein
MKILMNKTWITIFVLLIGLSCIVGSAQSAYIKFFNSPDSAVDTEGSYYYISHYKDGKEGADFKDILWKDSPNIEMLTRLRLSSRPYGEELHRDYRPIYSITPVDLVFDIEFKDGGVGQVVCDNSLSVIEINNNDGAFNNKPMTFQQNSLTGDPNEMYPVIDLRRALSFIGKVPMYNPDGSPLHLSGIYQEGQVYAKGFVRFDRYLSDLNDDKVVDVKDLALMVQHWMETGFALPGDLSGEFGIPDGRVDLFDLAVMAEEWGIRFMAP